jgi:UDP-GlcNAc:undecaprenyl-phosphate GlcNAc-1-phosphate transferase
MLLGLLLAYVPISSIASLDYASLTPHDAVNRFPEILPLLVPAVILVIPGTDVLLAIVRRARAGLSPASRDMKHLHYRLLEIGHSHRSSVLIMYLWAGLFSGVAVWLSITRVKLIVLAVTTLAAMLALLLMSMRRLRPWRRPAVALASPPIVTAARPAPAQPGAASQPESAVTERQVAGVVPIVASRYEGNGASQYASGSTAYARPGGTDPQDIPHLASDGRGPAEHPPPDRPAPLAPDGTVPPSPYWGVPAHRR